MAPSTDWTLSDAEAADRLRRDGFNELPSAKPKSLAAITFDVIREPMFLLLMASGAVYLLLGDPAESALLLVAVFLVIAITLYQEQKTERALQALRDLSAPSVPVVRGGVVKRVPSHEVVSDDLILLHEGDRVPADARVIACRNLFVDESLLTGESVPVRKVPGVADAPRDEPGGDDRPYVYSGTLVISGEGRARVVATGIRTELGRIGSALSRIQIGKTALQLEVDHMVRWLAAAGIAACVAVGVAYAGARHRWLDGALAGLTLAISMVPEEFPVILTVFLALGAWRISRHHVLARRMSAIETLGAASVLCVDKTGTLTANRMSVVEVSDAGSSTRSSREIIETAVLASRSDPFDPMERAFHDFARQLDVRSGEPRLTLEREYPLSDALLAVVHAWIDPSQPAARLIAAKGAPEAILSLCSIAPATRREILSRVERMAGDGQRVLAVARGSWDGEPLPDSPASFTLHFCGLVGLADPVRPGVVDAIAECRSARVRVVMITGDHPATAMNIARQIGLPRPSACLTGADIAGLDDEALAVRARDVDVYARIVPTQKLRLVNVFKRAGQVVAMTGDGVNDAPALKAADIGIAMGGRGTDVAREAAALVLLDDDFSSIVRAVRHGRRIYDNIEKATSYVLAIHVPIAGISLIPVFLGWPLVLMPLHVIFMELIADPACSIVFEMEREEPGLMRRAPRDPNQRLFTSRLLIRSLMQGGGALLASLLVLWASTRIGAAEADVRTLTFVTLILTNLALILANRSLSGTAWQSWRIPTQALSWLLAGTFGALTLIVSVPFMRDLFRLSRLHADDLFVVAVAGAGAFVWMEMMKRLVPSSVR